jgi:hypothetical protein
LSPLPSGLILLEKPTLEGMIKYSSMYIAITFSIILITVMTLTVLRLLRPGYSYAWPIAVVGSFIAWMSVFLWQIELPGNLVLYNYKYLEIFNFTISLSADGINYPYALGISSLVMTAIITSAMKAREANPLGWVTILIIAVFGLSAVLANNPLTLVIAWSLLDIAGLISSLNASENPIFSERAVFSFSFRVIGTGLILWAGILDPAFGKSFTLASNPGNIGMLLILGVIIRSCAIFFRLPYSKDSSIRNGYETTYKLISIAATLVLLSHIMLDIGHQWTLMLILIILAVAGILSVYHWLTTPREITSQPFWIFGLISLSTVSTLQGNPVGSAAWGSASLFTGGLLFLYTARNKVLTIILIASAYILSSLPFSLTATGWSSLQPASWVVFIVLIPLLSLLLSGYIRSILLDEKESLDNQPRWVKIFYPTGLVTLALTGLVLGATGWDGAGQIGALIPALISTVLTVVMSIILVRLPTPARLESPFISKPAAWVEFAASLGWGLFRTLRGLLDILSAIFEGDGGVLWTILFLVVFISILGIYAF